MNQNQSLFATPQRDVVAGIVVFLVALPLCLGIAIASGMPPLSGLVAGICGGILVPLISKAPLSVSGPAAGLTSIVLMELGKLGGGDMKAGIAPFLTAVILAGALQFVMGMVKAGRLSAMVPGSVIKGMLASIGITIVMKQIPYAVGQTGSLFELHNKTLHAGSAIIAAISLVVLYGWKKTPMGKVVFLSPALVVVALASVLGVVFAGSEDLALQPSEFVAVPLGGFAALVDSLPRPDLAAVARGDVWVAAATIAVVASIETLLCLQAVDRIDPLRRHSPPDRELLAQGISNAASGLLGGLPMTSVIVRSGANVAAGGRNRLSALVHGVLLLVAVVFAGELLNRIPLAALAAVLIQVGLNLCKPSMIRAQAKLGVNQMLPFVITIGAVLATDLLKGVIVGILVGIAFVLRQNAQGAVAVSREDGGAWRFRFRRDATFITKPQLLSALDEVADGSRVVIDASGEYVDQDVREAIAGFVDDAKHRNIQVQLVGIDVAGAGGSGH